MSKHIDLCDPYPWEDTRFLFRFTWATKPKDQLCFTELVNEALFLSFAASLLAWILGSLLNNSYIGVFLFILVGAYIAIDAYTFFTKSTPKSNPPTTHTQEGAKEHSSALPNSKVLTYPDVYEGFSEQSTKPIAANPFMNPLVNEITGADPKAPADSITSMESKLTLDDFYRVQMTSDPTDVFGRSQSQREFYTVPGASIPNDQGSYQNWLYRIPGKTCKEGGRENCLPGTEGAVIPWLNQLR